MGMGNAHEDSGGARTGPAPTSKRMTTWRISMSRSRTPEMDTAYLEVAVEPAPLVLTSASRSSAAGAPRRCTSLRTRPDRLDNLPKDRPIVVMCAHGNRSYGVTAYLNEQGFDAHNLTGGITRWRMQGGDTEVGAS